LNLSSVIESIRSDQEIDKNKRIYRCSGLRTFSRCVGVGPNLIPISEIRQVSQAAIVENKQLGAALAFIRGQQLRREPERRSTKAPRRRDQRNARLFKVG
jgi:hypothetical protein